MKRLTLFVVLTCFACHADETVQKDRRMDWIMNNNDIRVFFLPPSWLVPPLANRSYSAKDFEVRTQGKRTELALPAVPDRQREVYLFENGNIMSVRFDGSGTNETRMFNESVIFKLVSEAIRPDVRLAAAANSLAKDLLEFATGMDTGKQIAVCATKRDGHDALEVAFPNGIHWRFAFGGSGILGGVIMERFDYPLNEAILHSSLFGLCCTTRRITFISNERFQISFKYDRFDSNRDELGVLVRDADAKTVSAYDFSGKLVKSQNLPPPAKTFEEALERISINPGGDPFDGIDAH